MQSKLVDAIRSFGGYAIKKSNKFSAGILDLEVVMTRYAPFDIEVKYLGEVGHTFNRKVETTALQKKTLSEKNGINPGHTAAIVGVTFTRARKHYVVFIPEGQDHVTERDKPCLEIKSLSQSNLSPILSSLRVPHPSQFSTSPPLLPTYLASMMPPRQGPPRQSPL